MFTEAIGGVVILRAVASPPDVRPFVALLLYVPASLGYAVTAAKQHATRTVFWIFFLGVMFLPELVAFDAPLIPPLTKYEFAGLMSLAAAYLVHKDRLLGSKPLRGVDLFFVLTLLGNIGTVLTNADTLSFGVYWWDKAGNLVAEPRILSGHTHKDIIAITVRDSLSMYVPYLMGRVAFRTLDDAKTLTQGIVKIALIYAPGCLLEARISPQIHKWVYGYASTGIAGVVRGDGFKPVMFQNSGLAVATFLFCAVACAAVLAKRKEKVWGLPAIAPMLILMVTLALSHNMAALLYTLVAIPIIFMSRGKLAITAAVVLAILVLLYPPIRAFQMVDVYAFIEWLTEITPERADSLHVRFYNEDILYERAEERLTFGWGGYGRNRVYDERGKDICLTDGEWIIRVGCRGIIGFIGSFGLILAPIFVTWRRANRIPKAGRVYVDALAIICALIAVDLLPNSLFTKLPFFFGGALIGLARGLEKEAKQQPLAGHGVAPPGGGLPPGMVYVHQQAPQQPALGSGAVQGHGNPSGQGPR